MFNEQATKTEGTKEQYRSHYFRIARMAAKEFSVPEVEIRPSQVAATFRKNEAGWSQKTARAYRAALVFMFDEMGSKEAEIAKETIYHIHEDGEERMRSIEEIKSERLKLGKSELRTSAKKAKQLSLADYDQLRAELYISTSKYAEATTYWFMAGLLTGLRPTEWREVKLGLDDKNRKVMVVKNAKNTNGRAHGNERTLVIENFSQEDREIIETHIANIQGYSEQGDEVFGEFYDNCRRLIRHVAARIWPRRLKHATLYTARHMFAADVKNQFDTYGVAALMGHASTRTASTHYAPKWSTANGGSKIQPGEKDVLAVKERNESKESPRIIKRQKFLDDLKSKRATTMKSGFE